jgi:hypothetical protein
MASTQSLGGVADIGKFGDTNSISELSIVSPSFVLMSPTHLLNVET